MDIGGSLQMWIDNVFPGMEHIITSPPTDEYNCIAWPAGDQTTWWSDADGYRWPSAKRASLTESLVEVFVGLGYETCDNANLEEGFEKVALYARGPHWKHAARQLPSGYWTSKLGPDEDIQHATPEALIGDHYGAVYCIMRRQHRA